MRVEVTSGPAFAADNGLRMIEAKTGTTIPISSDDLVRGKALDPRDCAGACAVKRLPGHPIGIFMRDLAYLAYVDDGEMYRYRLSPESKRAILEWDRNGTPFSEIVLTHISPADRLDAVRTRGTARGPHVTRRFHNAISKRLPIRVAI